MCMLPVPNIVPDSNGQAEAAERIAVSLQSGEGESRGDTGSTAAGSTSHSRLARAAPAGHEVLQTPVCCRDGAVAYRVLWSTN